MDAAAIQNLPYTLSLSNNLVKYFIKRLI